MGGRGLDWSRAKVVPLGELRGSVVLESRFEGSKKAPKTKRFQRAIDAVLYAWAGRPAVLSRDGRLGVLVETKWGDAVLRYAVRVDGRYLSADGWRALKAEIQRSGMLDGVWLRTA